MSEIPRFDEGGLKLTEEQAALLTEKGIALKDPVEYAPPATIEDFRHIDLNNFPWRFCKYGDDRVYRNIGIANKYTGFQATYFQRGELLYPELLEEISQVEMGRDLRELLDTCARTYDTEDYTQAIEAFRKHYEEFREPRLFIAW